MAQSLFPTGRCAIVGTAPSWRACPWTDPGLSVLSLNDAYQLGIPRADLWFDIHPLNRFIFLPKGKKVIQANQIPPGHYVRPEGYLDWLQALTIPVYLNAETMPTWPHARAFPRERIEAELGRYFASTPAWMLAWAVLEGAREVSIYGIHLATEREYVEQRPNFEWVIGWAQGRGVRIVIASEAPLLKHSHRYGYELRPQDTLQPIQTDLAVLRQQQGRLTQQLASRPWWKSARAWRREYRELEARAMDVKQMLQRAQLALI